jgi:hypothetical protein
MADRLNKVDPDKYRALWNESFARWRAAGDDSARARREQADRDKEALYDYQAYGDGDVAQRTGLNLETWLAGRGVSDTGAARIRAAQSGDKAKQEKGLGVGESGFVRDTKAELSKFAPDPGTTQKSRAAAAQWWAERNADAINAYTTWVDSHPGKKPTAEEVAKLKASVISGVRPNPKKPESIGAAARALTVQGGAGKPSRTGRKKVFNGVTYWELSDGNAERE